MKRDKSTGAGRKGQRRQRKPKRAERVEKADIAPLEDGSFTAGVEARRGKESDEPLEAQGLGKGGRTIDEDKRRKAHRDVLLETDKLIRPHDKEGQA